MAVEPLASERPPPGARPRSRGAAAVRRASLGLRRRRPLLLVAADDESRRRRVRPSLDGDRSRGHRRGLRGGASRPRAAAHTDPRRAAAAARDRGRRGLRVADPDRARARADDLGSRRRPGGVPAADDRDPRRPAHRRAGRAPVLDRGRHRDVRARGLRALPRRRRGKRARSRRTRHSGGDRGGVVLRRRRLHHAHDAGLAGDLVGRSCSRCR
jgi:hypothetical protein